MVDKKISLIIAVYDRADFLELVLRSIENQSCLPYEILVAEDGRNPGILLVVEKYRKKGKLNILHVTHEDCGFRKNKILNKAIRQSSGEYLLFIDGDCVLHRHYVRAYAKRATKGVCLFGRRVFLNKKITDRMLGLRDHVTLKDLCFSSGVRHREEALYFPFFKSKRAFGVKGCSFCVHKKDIVDINGFDEDFIGPYFGEDTDVERRLRLIEIQFECLKYKAIIYHLYHFSGDRSEAYAKNEALYHQKKYSGSFFCKNGLN